MCYEVLTEQVPWSNFSMLEVVEKVAKNGAKGFQPPRILPASIIQYKYSLTNGHVSSKQVIRSDSY